MSVSPALALIPDRCILVRKNLQVSGNFSLERGGLLSENQIKVECKKRGLLFDFQNEGSDPHATTNVTLNMDNFVKLLSLLLFFPKEKRKSQSCF